MTAEAQRIKQIITLFSNDQILPSRCTNKNLQLALQNVKANSDVSHNFVHHEFCFRRRTREGGQLSTSMFIFL